MYNIYGRGRPGSVHTQTLERRRRESRIIIIADKCFVLINTREQRQQEEAERAGRGADRDWDWDRDV